MPYRMTVDEYERIGGLLDDPRVELIDGYLVKKMPKEPEHKWATKKALKALDALLPPGWTSQMEEAVRISAYDEPEPDIAIVRGSDDDWKHRNPGPADVALLVEVSDSTSRKIARWPGFMRAPGSRSTGSSTWSTARLRSTPSRALQATRRWRSLHPAMSWP